MEILVGFAYVTKMIADMICGPAFIVMARGRIFRFIEKASPGSNWERKKSIPTPIHRSLAARPLLADPEPLARPLRSAYR
jgi:hypothetical protein